MYAAFLLGLVAISFCGVRAEDDEAATLELMEPWPKTLQALQPKFLVEASEEARQQFDAIIADKSLTLSETEGKLSKWAAEQGEETESQFEDAKKKLRSMFEKVQEAIAASSISDAAKQAFAKIDDIIADKKETAQRRAQQIKAYVDSLSEDVRSEMKKFMKLTLSNVFDEIKSEIH
uniref:ANIS5_cation-bd domain-containing protein n=1 Tax=Ascaris lumbricoides TaxID=6252 RepID=A0A0M3HFY6_ASCLU